MRQRVGFKRHAGLLDVFQFALKCRPKALHGSYYVSAKSKQVRAVETSKWSVDPHLHTKNSHWTSLDHWDVLKASKQSNHVLGPFQNVYYPWHDLKLQESLRHKTRLLGKFQDRFTMIATAWWSHTGLHVLKEFKDGSSGDKNRNKMNHRLEHYDCSPGKA